MKKLPIAITGASNGIGRATALHLCNPDQEIIIMDLDQDRATETRNSVVAKGGQARTITIDVSDHDGVQEAFQRIGPLGGLVHAAGIVDTHTIEDMAFAQWERVISVNLSGTFSVVQAASEQMVEGASIVTIASMAAQTTSRYASPAYSASKGGVIALTKSLATAFGQRGIRINSVAPGAIDTQMLDHFGSEGRTRLAKSNPLGRLGTPDDIASTIEFLLFDRSCFLTGQVISVNGGAYV